MGEGIYSDMAAQRSHGTRADRTFERLYRRHVRDVYRYALAVLQHPADAEDVTQTTFMNAYRALERGERPRSAHNWLIAIAHNVCRQRFRQSARRPTEVALDDDVGERLVDDTVPTPEEIRRALGQLGFNQRAALVMRELEGRSYAEIADVLGLSISAVEALIFRARRALREQLEGTLTCHDAELAISKQLDRRLSRAERASLRAHLRECPECATFARRQRAQRSALRSLGAVPLPASLASALGGAGGGAAGVIAAKTAAVVTAAAVAGGASYEVVHRSVAPPKPATSTAAAARPAQKQIRAAPTATVRHRVALQPVRVVPVHEAKKTHPRVDRHKARHHGATGSSKQSRRKVGHTSTGFAATEARAEPASKHGHGAGRAKAARTFVAPKIKPHHGRSDAAIHAKSKPDKEQGQGQRRGAAHGRGDEKTSHGHGKGD